MFPEGRFFDFAIVAILALIIIGPKDLPIAMRKLGQFIARMRGMAAEFRASFDEMARQSELDELRKEVEALRNAQPSAMAAQAVGLGEAHADIAETFADINAGLATGEVQFSLSSHVMLLLRIARIGTARVTRRTPPRMHRPEVVR